MLFLEVHILLATFWLWEWCSLSEHGPSGVSETQPILTIQVHAQTVLLTKHLFHYHSGTLYLQSYSLAPLPPLPTLKAESFQASEEVPNPRGCSGGRRSDGNQCFSVRLMWRSGGVGESECQCVVCGGIGHLPPFLFYLLGNTTH